MQSDGNILFLTVILKSNTFREGLKEIYAGTIWKLALTFIASLEITVAVNCTILHT